MLMIKMIVKNKENTPQNVH